MQTFGYALVFVNESALKYPDKSEGWELELRVSEATGLDVLGGQFHPLSGRAPPPPHRCPP